MKMFKPMSVLLIVLALMPSLASALVCNNQSIVGSFNGTAKGGLFLSTTQAQEGTMDMAVRYAFSPSTANTTTGTVDVSGLLFDLSGVSSAVSSLNGSYTVSTSCFVTLTYKLYLAGNYYGTVTSRHYMNLMTNPAAPTAGVPLNLQGIERVAVGAYQFQWSTDLHRLTR